MAENGWVGFTDHYWMSTLAAQPGQSFTAVAKYTAATDTYQTDMRLPAVTVAPGATAQAETWLFAGAKVWSMLRDYQNEKQIDRFVDAIDWGWFFFLTKPIFIVLHEMNKLIGNMGLAIIGLTFVIKLILFPLAYKSYVSMSKMKVLQPEMEKIKERIGDDRMAMQQEVMALYKREKVNPAAGCLPILLQIPIFFSLYKVIFVTIELRHAPFFGWIRDLSAPDPTSWIEPLRPLALGGAQPRHLHRHPVHRRLADPARHLHVAAAEAEPDAHRQDPGDDLHLDAVGLHVHARQLRQRPGDLLGGEQHHHLRPAVRHHAQPGGAAERARQHPRSAQEEAQEGGLGQVEARVSHLWRHPIKGHGVEAVASVTLAAGATMPWDRVWAIAHEAARVKPGAGDWAQCANFSRGAKSFELMAIRAEVDEAAGRVTLTHPRREPLTVDPDDAGDAARLVAWVTPLVEPRPGAAGLRGPRRPRHDRQRLSLRLDPEPRQPRRARRIASAGRSPWSASAATSGSTACEPFAEFDLVGRDIRLGDATLRVRERITRCKATTVDPATGVSDADTLGALRAGWGHEDFGVYAEVVAGGRVAVGDAAAA